MGCKSPRTNSVDQIFYGLLGVMGFHRHGLWGFRLYSFPLNLCASTSSANVCTAFGRLSQRPHYTLPWSFWTNSGARALRIESSWCSDSHVTSPSYWAHHIEDREDPWKFTKMPDLDPDKNWRNFWKCLSTGPDKNCTFLLDMPCPNFRIKTERFLEVWSSSG